MRLSFEILKNLFKRTDCLNCSSLARTAGFLCEACWMRLEKQWCSSISTYLQVLPAVQVRPLFHWVPGESDLLSRLILASKGNGHSNEWQWAAQRWLAHQTPSLRYPKTEAQRLVFVPMPSPHGRRHALELAQSFVNLLGGEVIPCLRSYPSKKQQSLSRAERGFRRIDPVEDFSPESLSGCTVIFIDDIVTTGLTAEASRCALNLEHVEVWCLAHRSRLAMGLRVC